MSELPSQALIVHNQSELEDLAWELESAEGQFSLMLARCNYTRLRDELVEHLRQICSVMIRVLVLQPSETALYTRIQSELKGEQPGALMVFGLETVADLEQLLSNANQVREEFRKNCPFPIVLWVTDEVMKGLVHAAPDLESWSTKTHFTLPLETLSQTLQQAADSLFDNLLDPTATDSFDLLRRTLDLGFLHSSEVESATQDLRLQGQELSPNLQASLDFAEGLTAIDSVEALVSFERSLQFWQAQESKDVGGILSLKIGLLLVYIGRVKFAIAESASPQIPDWGTIRQTLQQAIARFEQANRSDLVALCVPQLQRVLQKLQAWDELAATARKGLELHQVYGTQTRLSQDYGFLARVMLEQQQWASAQQSAQQALIELAAEPEDRNWLRGLYRLFLAQVARQLENPEAAIEHLKAANAREVSDRGYPKIAIRILQELRTLHFDRKQYLEAFEAKQERLSIEQQYGIRAFVGAGRLRPQRQEAVAEFQAPTEGMVAPEIAAAGRQQDLERLIERVERRDYRLIVIHGNSGVGKSSLVNAGLVPMLQQKPIDARDNVSIVLRVYTQWAQELERLLSAKLGDQELDETQSLELKTQNLLAQLRQLDQRNLRTVLIFDQFEEFFFVCPKPEDRKPFFDFLAQCLQILSLKVFLSLREDYLHYLLEFNRLLTAVKEPKTGIDILSRNVLYGLGNFSLEDTRAIIHSLTERAHFYLEPALVDQLVVDLAGDLGEVRPIELQVVGAQLQADNITLLSQYRSLGRNSKEALVKGYVDEVVEDCGAENRRLAELILYLLTDEKGTRPSKTRAELERELQALATHPSRANDPLDLVLRIFVDSGLVFLLPEIPADRYQLVHDYIAAFIRQQQEPMLGELIAELEKEREQRQQAEVQRGQAQEKLNRVLKRRLREAYLAGVALAVLFTLAVSFWLSAESRRKRVEVAEIKALNSVSQARLTSHNQLEALVASVQAGQRVEQTAVPTDLRNETLVDLRQAFKNIQETNRFEGHSDYVFSVSFSPDGKLIASTSADDTVKLWSRDGTLIKTLPKHGDDVWIATFSPDGKILASASDDRKIRLWSREGALLKELTDTGGFVTSVSFSPDSKTFASAGEDGKIRLWSREGVLLKTFVAHGTLITSLSFSPDGQQLASASEDKTVKLWKQDGTLLKTLNGHSDAVWSVSFSPDGKTIASASFDKKIKLWKRDGQLLRTLEGHTNRVLDVSFSPDSKILASASLDGTVMVWRQRDGQVLTTLKGHGQGVRGVSFSPDGQTIASAGLDKTIRLWKYSDLFKTLRGHQGKIRSVAFSPNGRLLASSSTDKTVKLWDANGVLLRTLIGIPARVVSLSFSSDSQLLAGAVANNEIRLWKVDGTTVQTLKGHRKQVWDVQFSSDDQLLASASEDKTVKLWRRDGTLLKTLQAHKGLVGSVSFSPNGQTLASGSDDGTIKLWKRDGTLIKTISADSQGVTSVSFSPDGQLLASAGFGNTVKLWSRDGKLLKTLSGHQNRIWSLSFSPDSQLIASGDASGTINLWSREGILLQTFQDGNFTIWNLSFSPSRRMLASASDDTTVKLWKLDLPVLNALARDNLSDLLVQSCNWLSDYLRTNSSAQSAEPNLCKRGRRLSLESESRKE